MGTGWRNARPAPKVCHLCASRNEPTRRFQRGRMFHYMNVDGLDVAFDCPTTKSEYERDREVIARTVAEVLDEQRRGT